MVSPHKSHRWVSECAAKKVCIRYDHVPLKADWQRESVMNPFKMTLYPTARHWCLKHPDPNWHRPCFVWSSLTCCWNHHLCRSPLSGTLAAGLTKRFLVCLKKHVDSPTCTPELISCPHMCVMARWGWINFTSTLEASDYHCLNSIKFHAFGLEGKYLMDEDSTVICEQLKHLFIFTSIILVLPRKR